MLIRILLAATLLFSSAGFARADFQSGMTAFRAGDYAVAAQEWEPLAASGNLAALNNFALLYSRGLGVEKDRARAIELYGQAADGGYAIAQFNLAMLYMKSGPQDSATVLFRQAAELGHARAQYHLGLRYAEGIGVERDQVRAVIWLAIAAEAADDDLAVQITKLMDLLREDLAESEIERATLLATFLRDTLPEKPADGVLM